MSLGSTYIMSIGKMPDFFNKIKDGQAPSQFTQQLLKDWGFASSNDRSFIPLLKDLRFLSPDGQPTSRYHDYRNHSQSRRVMGEAIKEAYSDIFLIKAQPTKDDRASIEGKFKSYHNVSDRVSQIMASTFLGLVALADITNDNAPKPQIPDISLTDNKGTSEPIITNTALDQKPSLHYNIQIHLPATKDVEVYNAIFKSLKEHLYEV